MATVAFAGRVTGSMADLCALAGAVITGRDDALAWVVGGAAQLLVAVIAALAYAAVFEWVTRRGGALIGFAVAIPHAVVAGLVVGFLPVARMLDAGITPPGAFLEYRGAWTVAAFILAHLVFGVAVGALYGKARHAVTVQSAVWLDVTGDASAVNRFVACQPGPGLVTAS